MSFPTTLQDIKTYINGLGSFPVSRSTQVFYGLSNTTNEVYVAFGDLKAVPTYTTCGVSFWTSTFTVHVLHTSNQNALTLASSVNDVIALQKVTPKTSACYLEGFEAVQEDQHRFHVMMSYSLVEGT